MIMKAMVDPLLSETFFTLHILLYTIKDEDIAILK